MSITNDKLSLVKGKYVKYTLIYHVHQKDLVKFLTSVIILYFMLARLQGSVVPLNSAPNVVVKIFFCFV